MRCTFSPVDEPDERGWRTWECSRCGQSAGKTPDPADRIHATCKVPGWGDYVTYYLALLGITKAKVSAFLGRDCGCGERSAALNKAGDWWQRWWKS